MFRIIQSRKSTTSLVRFLRVGHPAERPLYLTNNLTSFAQTNALNYSFANTAVLNFGTTKVARLRKSEEWQATLEILEKLSKIVESPDEIENLMRDDPSLLNKFLDNFDHICKFMTYDSEKSTLLSCLIDGFSISFR
jgi:hypothetical protein